MSNLSAWVDRAIAASFAIMLVISLTLDLVPVLSGHGEVSRDKLATKTWPPQPVVDLFFFWCENFDPLLQSNPKWLEGMGFASFFYQLFYVCGIWAFAKQQGEWIKQLCIVWGSMLSYSTALILVEQVSGPHPAPSLPVTFLAYGPYVVFPLFVIWRAWGPGRMFPVNISRSLRRLKNK